MGIASDKKIDSNFISTISTLTAFNHSVPSQHTAGLVYDRITTDQACIFDTSLMSTPFGEIAK